MADETAAADTNQDTAPSMNQVGQYIRDLSFENPGAPNSILAGGSSPNLSFNINLAYKKQADDVYSVETTLVVKAERENSLLFNVELVYGGVFVVRNVPEEQLPALLLVECPRQTFPFARQVIANVIQQGGFPPVLLQPVDFDAIFRQNVQLAQAQAAKSN
ncbi:MAG TPA: protein-export chaperone SecB [Arsenicitalea sp.]|nr:protein-export chaperone SecB [Arsenicitalea sp.]